MNTDFVDSLSFALEIVRKFCLQRNLKMSVAESATSGLIQALFSTMNEAGLFYKGGITAYCCEMKAKLLGIPLAKCMDTNGVNQEITDSMAQNICTLFDADLGIALTGYASPVPEQDIFEKFAYGSIYLEGRLICSKRFQSQKEKQFDVQVDFATQLIIECSKCLEIYPINY